MFGSFFIPDTMTRGSFTTFFEVCLLCTLLLSPSDPSSSKSLIRSIFFLAMFPFLPSPWYNFGFVTSWFILYGPSPSSVEPTSLFLPFFPLSSEFSAYPPTPISLPLRSASLKWCSTEPSSLSTLAFSIKSLLSLLESPPLLLKYSWFPLTSSSPTPLKSSCTLNPCSLSKYPWSPLISSNPLTPLKALCPLNSRSSPEYLWSPLIPSNPLNEPSSTREFPSSVPPTRRAVDPLWWVSSLFVPISKPLSLIRDTFELLLLGFIAVVVLVISFRCLT